MPRSRQTQSLPTVCFHCVLRVGLRALGWTRTRGSRSPGGLGSSDGSTIMVSLRCRMVVDKETARSIAESLLPLPQWVDTASSGGRHPQENISLRPATLASPTRFVEAKGEIFHCEAPSKTAPSSPSLQQVLLTSSSNPLLPPSPTPCFTYRVPRAYRGTGWHKPGLYYPKI
jgi:hypothetical protein